ncbi:MAG: 3-dehydroquinate synthase [Candidatus Marinimicrobia bacterium]|nr:3-dehydroquinate synthase [Candidatus Neomarinimicrobiota bacterium]
MPEIQRLELKHQLGKYDCLVGSDLLPRLPEFLQKINAAGPIGIITNKKVNDLYGDTLRTSLQTADYVTRTILIPDGEAYKTLATVEQALSALIAQGMERSGTIVTLGGGVSTDLGGFVASILFRGIKLVHIPTTLLAMVDASVGGKTGVNHSSGKNLIGSFYQPDLVLMDIDTLKSLAVRDRVSGYGEMFKMGAIRDAEYLEFLSTHMEALIEGIPDENLTKAIARSCALKAQVVEADEKESDLRRILNFGHTIGHAIETSLGYGEIRHGEAVILGMYAAGWLSNQVGNLSSSEWEKLAELLKRIPMKLNLDSLDPATIEKITRLDKKVANSQLNFVLLNKLGEAQIQVGIPILMIKLAVEAIKKAWKK